MRNELDETVTRHTGRQTPTATDDEDSDNEGGRPGLDGPTLRPSGLEPDRQKSVEGPVTQAERFVDL